MLQLGDVVFVDLPAAGKKVTAGGSFGAVESVKAASDLYSPVAGEVIEVNSALGKDPAIVNQSPYEKVCFELFCLPLFLLYFLLISLLSFRLG